MYTDLQFMVCYQYNTPCRNTYWNLLLYGNNIVCEIKFELTVSTSLMWTPCECLGPRRVCKRGESVLENIFYRVNNKFLSCKYPTPKKIYT